MTTAPAMPDFAKTVNAVVIRSSAWLALLVENLSKRGPKISEDIVLTQSRLRAKLSLFTTNTRPSGTRKLEREQTMKEITFHFVYSATIVKTPKGYTLRSMGNKIHVKDGDVVRLWNDTTDEQMMLSVLLAGGKFREFDPVKIFGTDKPKGSVISDWLKSMWGTGEVYAAMAWVKNTVPLDVLLGFGGPLPGVTASAETGWHWSCSMQGVRNPRFFESRKEFKKYVHSR